MPKVPAHFFLSRLTDRSGLAIKRTSDTEIDDSSIIIQMRSAGVCGTDLAMLSGKRACHAEVLGHEGVGIVISAPEPSVVARGDRVVINPVHASKPDVVIGHSCDGIFREFFRIDPADCAAGGLLVKCPDKCPLGDSELVLAEPLASVLYSIELLLQQSGPSTLLIRGSGTVGILAAKLWPLFTDSNAILVTQSESHAAWLRESIRWPPKTYVCAVSSPAHSTDAPGAAMLCCSRQHAEEGLGFLLNAVSPEATIDLLAGFSSGHKEPRLGCIHLDEIRWANLRGVKASAPTVAKDSETGKTISLIGHRGTAERHILQAIDLLSRRVISIDDIPHRSLKLQELPAAVKDMLSVETRLSNKWVKAIVNFSTAPMEN